MSYLSKVSFPGDIQIRLLDLSNKFVKQYLEIKPFTKGQDGKYLNETHRSIFKEIDPINVDEKIQSYREDVDLATIFRRAEMAGDTAILDAFPKDHLKYGDTVGVPTDLNSAFAYKKEVINEARKVIGDDLVNKFVNGDDEDFKKALDNALEAKFKSMFPDYHIENGKAVKNVVEKEGDK